MPDYDPASVAARQARARAAAEARRLEAECQTAHLTRAAIDACEKCDRDGYRGANVCDHQDHATAAHKGRAACMAAISKLPKENQ